jgi:hypothetical protein
VFVRKDLDVNSRAVQSCHAVIEATRAFGFDGEHPHLVLIGVEDEFELDDVAIRLSAQNIDFRDFVEPDIGNQRTAIATQLVSGDSRRLFRRYKLLKGTV